MHVLWMKSRPVHFQPENMGLNLDGVLHRNHLSYQGRSSSEATKAQQIVLVKDYKSEGAVPLQLEGI